MEERQEAAINGRRSQNSERVRAHLYEREFRAKPVSRADGEVENVTRPRVEPRGALDGVTDKARFRRTNSDMHLGRERPPKTGPGTVIGGWQRGSLTPQMPPSVPLTPRGLRHGRQRAPPGDIERNAILRATSGSRRRVFAARR